MKAYLACFFLWSMSFSIPFGFASTQILPVTVNETTLIKDNPNAVENPRSLTISIASTSSSNATFSKLSTTTTTTK